MARGDPTTRKTSPDKAASPAELLAFRDSLREICIVRKGALGWDPMDYPAFRATFIEKYHAAAAGTPVVTTKYSARKEPASKITREMVDGWWKARQRPEEAELIVVVAFLLGDSAETRAQRDDLWQKWRAADRRKDRGAMRRAAPAEGRSQSGSDKTYQAIPIAGDVEASVAVDLRVTFTADSGMLTPDQLHVAVTINWGYDDDQDSRCRIRVREFHLLNREAHCEIVGDLFAEEPMNVGGVNVVRAGRRWECRPQDGGALSGPFRPNAPLYAVRGVRGASGLPRVEMIARCPGAWALDVEWMKDIAAGDELKHAVLAQFMKKRRAEENTAIHLATRGVELVESPP